MTRVFEHRKFFEHFGHLIAILVVDTWHHIDDRLRYLKRLRKTLAARGRIAVVDYKPGEMPVGPPETLRLPKRAIVDEFAKVGFRLARASDDLLPYQFVLVFEWGSGAGGKS